jgi:hypothetical protein
VKSSGFLLARQKEQFAKISGQLSEVLLNSSSSDSTISFTERIRSTRQAFLPAKAKPPLSLPFLAFARQSAKHYGLSVQVSLQERALAPHELSSGFLISLSRRFGRSKPLD